VIGKDRRSTESTGQRRRRSADPSRRRDPERTRQAIIEAANEEFGTHGFDGARVMRIAAAAGVNHQLITYHFGSKKGLYDAVNDRWLDRGTTMISSAVPLAETIRDFVRWPHEDKVGHIRMLARAELDGRPAQLDGWTARLLNLVEETKKRQARGEIRSDFEVGALTWALFAAAAAPELLPQLAAAFTGADPASAEFIDHYADELARVVYALADAAPGGSAETGAGAAEATGETPDGD
jgi:TetR/AcrR family transcriptional regulator